MLAWDMELGELVVQDNSCVIEFNVAEGQVLAGGLRIPLTSVSYNKGKLSMRIYNVTADKTKLNNPGNYTIETINIEPIAAGVFKGNFLYGGELHGDLDLQVPSVRLDMQLRDKVAYNINSVVGEPGRTIKYIVSFKPVE